MHKVWLVFKQDFKNIFTNGITFIMIILLLIIPAIFAGFTIKANGMPINSSSNVKVALVNKDIGGIVNNTVVNVGDKITRLIKQDTKIDWQITSYDDALRGLLVGKFYGMLVIPPEFTEGIATLTTDTPVLPKISYIMNNKESVFTPTFTETSSTKLQIYVVHGITYAINEATRSVLGKLDIDFTINSTELKGTVNAFLDLDEKREFYIERLKEYRELVGGVMISLSNLRDELPDLNQNIDRIESLGAKAERFIAIVDEMEKAYAETTNKSLLLQIDKTKELISEIQELTTYIKEETPQLQDMIKDSDEMVTQAYGTFNKVDSSIMDITRDLHGLEYKLGFLAENNDINKLIYIVENDPQLLKEYIAAPVLLERQDIKTLPNYSSDLAPFNITIAMWAGTVLLVTMLSTKFQVPQSKEENTSQEQINDISVLQEYFGKGLFFIVLSCIQDIIAVIAIKQVLGIYIANLGLFFGLAIIGSITFTAIIYTLVSVLGNVGKVIIYLLSILQFFFLGGVFPTQIAPPVFQHINNVLPFIYVIGSLREVQIGIITSNLLKSSVILLSFTIWAILCGMIGRAFLWPGIEKLRLIVRASHLVKQDY